MFEHIATFKAKKYRKIYYCQFVGFGGNFVSFCTGGEVEENTIWEGVLNIPYLKDGEKIFIKDLNETVSILSVVKSTDGSAVYQVDKYYDLVEDEKTEESKIEAEEMEEKLNKIDEEREKRMKEIYSINEPPIIKAPEKQSWWKRSWTF